MYFYHKLVGDKNAVQTSLIMGLVKTPNWIYIMYINNLSVKIYITNREFVLLGNATSGGSGEGILVSWPRDPEDKDQEAQESTQKNPGATRSSTKEQYQDQLTLTFA